jgi:uncharacterized protein involved in exopolysaccharide biosynthesis
MIPEVSVRNAPPAAPAYEDDEVQAIRKWGGVLAHGWGVLAIGAIVGALLGWIAAARTPPLFEATSTVALSPPQGETAGIFAGSGMRTVFTSPTVLAKVVADLGLDRPPYSLTAASFGARHLLVEDIPTTYVTRLRARLPDPQLAARAATGVGEGAVELTARIWRDRIAAEAAALEKQLPTARQQLASAEQDWLASRLAVDKGGARAERIRVPRGVAPDASDRRSSSSNEKSLEERLAESRVEARGSNGIDRVYAREFELVRLENEVEVRRKVYMDVAGRLEEARVKLTATVSPLQLVERAPVPQRPLPGTAKRTIALGFLAGLVLAACLVVSREWQMSRRRVR